MDEPWLNIRHLLVLNAKKHLFRTNLPPESHARSPSVRSGQRLYLLRSPLAQDLLQAALFCCSGSGKKHDDMSKVARHVPSMFMRMGGGPVCGTLMLRKAKHW